MASPAADKTNGKPRRKRRWLQFGLPSLLGLVTLSAIAMGLIVNQAERQRSAVAAVRRLGGHVHYDGDEPFGRDPPPSWLRKWLGDDYFRTVIAVRLRDTQVNDAGLERLQGLRGLQGLYLDNTQVSDAGLAHLEGLTALERLGLDNTHVSDAGVQHLKRLTSLKWLYLYNTQVSESGVAELRAALPACNIVGYE